ncbi:hypothetical protein ABFS82_08G022300 [Erythranthe guttata]
MERKYDRKKVPIYDRRSLVISSIPDFWLTAFMKHPILGTLLTQEDPQNFKINPYFENETLSKTVDYTDEDLETTCTTIRWKEGKVGDLIKGDL